jgi:hypothetical protein
MLCVHCVHEPPSNDDARRCCGSAAAAADHDRDLSAARASDAVVRAAVLARVGEEAVAWIKTRSIVSIINMWGFIPYCFAI